MAGERGGAQIMNKWVLLALMVAIAAALYVAIIIKFGSQMG